MQQPPADQPILREYRGADQTEAQQHAWAEWQQARAAGYHATAQSWDERTRTLTVRYERSFGQAPPPTVIQPAGWRPQSSVGAWRILIAMVLIGLLAGAAIFARFSDLLDAPRPAQITVIVAGTDTGAVPRLESTVCRGTRIGLELPRCGDLIVPEDRARPDGTHIRIHYAVYPAQGPDGEPDAVVYLDGGPGGSPLTDGFLLRPFVDRRDVVVFDQRGTGVSEPTLDCPELDESDVLASVFGDANGIRSCRDRLHAEGVDRSQYTTAENAADVEDLRTALGYPAWNLYGISYGTRLALAVMRDHPAGVRSAVLDSVYPPDIDSYAQQATHAQRAFTTLFDACARQQACHDRFPDLQGTFFTTVTRLDHERPHVSVPRSDSTLTRDVELDGDMLIHYLFNKLYDTDAIPGLPSAIDAVARGDYDDLTTYLSESLAFDRAALATGSTSEGMDLSVQCSEEVPFSAGDATGVTDEQTKRMVEAFSIRGIRAACDIWDVPTVPAELRVPVTSESPTLLLSGDFDPVTPPLWAAQARRTLSRGQALVFPGVGHGVLGTTSCADGLVSEFLRTPVAKVDARCIGNLAGPRLDH